MNLVVVVTPIFCTADATNAFDPVLNADWAHEFIQTQLTTTLQNTLAKVLTNVNTQALALTAEPAPKTPVQGLSPREADVLTLIAKGLTQKEMGRVLNLSPATIGGYKKEIYRKLAISNAAEATLEAIKYKLVKVDELC